MKETRFVPCEKAGYADYWFCRCEACGYAGVSEAIVRDIPADYKVKEERRWLFCPHCGSRVVRVIENHIVYEEERSIYRTIEWLCP